MHQHDARSCCRNGGRHCRIKPERRDVIYHGGAGAERGACHRRLHGVDRHENRGVLSYQRLDHRDHPVELLVSRDIHRPTRPGRLPTDIDHYRAGTHQLISMGERRIGARKAAAIAEAIGSDVEDAGEDRLVE